MMCDDEDEELSSRQMFEKMCSKELQSRDEERDLMDEYRDKGMSPSDFFSE